MCEREKILVSVNITSYRRPDLLKLCLNSVLEQSYEDMEIIVLDDCSGDETEEVVKGYMSRDERVRYIGHETNQGNAYARNTALRNCRGKYIAFMDDDDVWTDRDKIKKQVEIFESSEDKNLGIICSNVVIKTSERDEHEKIVDLGDLRKKILIGNSIIYNSSVMTKKSILDKMGGFDTKLRRGIDSDFFRNCIIRYGHSVHLMPELTVVVKEYGDDRMTKAESKEKIMTKIESIDYVEEKYSEYLELEAWAYSIRKLQKAENYYRLWKITDERGHKDNMLINIRESMKKNWNAKNIRFWLIHVLMGR